MARTPTRPPFRSARLALWLAWLAVVAHLGLGYFSTAHAVQMLAAEGEGWVVVCTPTGLERIALDENGAPEPTDHSPADTRLLRCATCSATPIAATLPRDVVLQIAALEYTSPVVSRIAHLRSRTDAELRPPPRAPPALS